MRIFSLLFLLFPVLAVAQEQDIPINDQPFGLWKEQLKQEAISSGISEALVMSALNGLEPNHRVVELDRKQPESTITFIEYRARILSDARISKGERLYQEHKELLDRIAKDYGVQPRFIVALWGTETNYGGYTGNFSIVNSLATLAYDGRRSEFFRKELLHALKILDEGHITLDEMDGSWAGAMGQCQFMPSSFLNFAVDYNGDGKKDIWKSLPDIFASIANYLKQSGWNDELTWGREVTLTQPLDASLTEGNIYKSLSFWQSKGVRKVGGGDLPAQDLQAAITLPGAEDGPVYMIYSNYDVILKWNRSRYFATSVGLLSDEIAN